MPALTAAFAVFVAAVAGALIGVRLTAVPALSKRLVPFSGGVLIGIATFWVLPEMSVFFGWPWAAVWVIAGFCGLWLFDRYVYNVCPSCSHTHDHDACSTRLHGFAGPMLIAAALHSFLDGWSLPAASQISMGTAFAMGLALHKVPEGIALGIIVRSAVTSRSRALAGCALAESMTLLGAALEIAAAPFLGPVWIHALLAIAGGSFMYLGYHAVHGEYRRRGVVLAFMPALTGVAGSTVLRLLSR